MQGGSGESASLLEGTSVAGSALLVGPERAAISEVLTQYAREGDCERVNEAIVGKRRDLQIDIVDFKNRKQQTVSVW